MDYETKVLGWTSQLNQKYPPPIQKQPPATSTDTDIATVWSVFLQKTTVHGLPLWNHAKGKLITGKER